MTIIPLNYHRLWKYNFFGMKKIKSLFTTKIGRVWDGPWLEIFHSSQTPKSKTSSYMVTPNCHTLHIYTVEYLKLQRVPLATSICMNLEILFRINI